MKETVIELFKNYSEYAILLSIAISILVAILGLVPSVFVTAANVLFFGFWQGTIISFAGESIGAVIAFILYRFGFKSKVDTTAGKYPRIQKLLEAQGKDAFKLIFALRLIPFVPSGIVTFTAAVGRVSLVTFLFASSLGKIPALLLEAYAARNVLAFNWQGKAVLLIAGIYLLYIIFKRKKNVQ